jgi:two-component system sensor histidine kinase GlrK
LSLSLTGLGLLTLPLLIGMGNAMLKLEQLTNESQAAVSTSAASTLENQRIARSLANMERNARLFLLLQTPEQLELFDTAAVSMTMSLDALERLPHTPQIAASIQSVRLAASELATQVHNQNSNSGDAVIAELQRMTQAAGQIADGMRLLVSERLSALEDSTRQSQETLLWQAAALIPGTLILVLFFLLLIGRPLRQVDRAIRELGSGDFSHEISVTGPADIETLGRQLEWLRNRLQESTEEKNKFLRHMSHELKTPLANIREGTELLLDGSVGELDRQQKEVTGILRDNSLKLQRLIENLLTFSAWQTKTEAIELTEFELKPLVFAVLSLHRLNISNRKIKLDIDVSAIWISADEGKLRLVLENLVSNATKFTPDRGTIFVRAGMQAQQLVLDVADSGPGVAVEDRARIFEAFYQGRRLQGGHVGGTGIGLSVVQECVQAHGGTVQLMDPSEYPGAHFRVELPLRRTSDRPQLVMNG